MRMNMINDGDLRRLAIVAWSPLGPLFSMTTRTSHPRTDLDWLLSNINMTFTKFLFINIWYEWYSDGHGLHTLALDTKMKRRCESVPYRQVIYIALKKTRLCQFYHKYATILSFKKRTRSLVSVCEQ